jgi:hypothetical protein
MSRNTNSQYNLPAIGKKIAYKANRDGIAERFSDPAVQKSIEVDRARISYSDRLLHDVELTLVNTAKPHDAHPVYRLQSVPGSGKILRLVRLYEIHDIARFPRGQDFVSYCRLVNCAKASAGKRYGPSGTQIGHAYVQWAFSEAAVLFLRDHPAGQKSLARLEKKQGQGQAFTVLAQQLARAVYDMLTRDPGGDMTTCLHGEGSGGGEPVASLGHEGLSRAPVLCTEARTASRNAQEHIGAWP